MSLHINNNYTKKRGIGKKLLLAIRAVMLEEHVDVVPGDFNGAAWRRATSANTLSIIEEAFADCDLPMAPGPRPLWGPGAVPGAWSDVCGFLKPPDSNERWRVRQHGAFPIPHEALGIRQTDQSCHHEMWLHIDFLERRNGQAHHERHERRLLLKERFEPNLTANKSTKQARMQASIHLLQKIKSNICDKHRRGLPCRRQHHADLHRCADVTSSRPSAVDLMRRLSFRAQSCVFPASSVTRTHVTMSI